MGQGPLCDLVRQNAVGGGMKEPYEILKKGWKVGEGRDTFFRVYGNHQSGIYSEAITLGRSIDAQSVYMSVLIYTFDGVLKVRYSRGVDGMYSLEDLEKLDERLIVANDEMSFSWRYDPGDDAKGFVPMHFTLKYLHERLSEEEPVFSLSE